MIEAMAALTRGRPSSESSAMPKDLHVLYCHCAYTDLVSPEARQAVLRGLVAAGVAVQAVADLCGMAARRDPALAEVVKHKDLRIVACHPRAVRWLMAWAGTPLPRGGAEVLNLRTDGAEAVLKALGIEGDGNGDAAAAVEALEADLASAATREGAWVPWFPVIDYDRCKQCRQCLNFCLFGTYSTDAEGQVRATSPEKCKTNCPACARVCPEMAILFPKHRGGPIDGAEVSEADLARSDMRMGRGGRSREDIFEALRKRGPKGGGPDKGTT